MNELISFQFGNFVEKQTLLSNKKALWKLYEFKAQLIATLYGIYGIHPFHLYKYVWWWWNSSKCITHGLRHFRWTGLHWGVFLNSNILIYPTKFVKVMDWQKKSANLNRIFALVSLAGLCISQNYSIMM